jgi:hypothetical protein
MAASMSVMWIPAMVCLSKERDHSAFIRQTWAGTDKTKSLSV